MTRHPDGTWDCRRDPTPLTGSDPSGSEPVPEQTPAPAPAFERDYLAEIVHARQEIAGLRRRLRHYEEREEARRARVRDLDLHVAALEQKYRLDSFFLWPSIQALLDANADMKGRLERVRDAVWDMRKDFSDNQMYWVQASRLRELREACVTHRDDSWTFGKPRTPREALWHLLRELDDSGSDVRFAVDLWRAERQLSKRASTAPPASDMLGALREGAEMVGYG